MTTNRQPEQLSLFSHVAHSLAADAFLYDEAAADVARTLGKDAARTFATNAWIRAREVTAFADATGDRDALDWARLARDAARDAVNETL